MCEPASMIVTKDKVFWSETTDSHHEIISEFGLVETGVRGVNLVPVEIAAPKRNLSKPLSKWEFKIDYQGYERELPEWWDAEKYEKRCRACLKDWADCRLKGWKIKEAFNPVHPFKIKRDKNLDTLALLKDWASVWDSVRASVWDSVRASVRASVWDSVWDSVWASVRASVWASVWDSVWDSVGASVWASVRASVWASVWAYTGSLFHNIKDWKYLEERKNPWRSLRKLWLGGYVPSFDGKTWRLHAGPKAEVVFEITAEELRKK